MPPAANLRKVEEPSDWTSEFREERRDEMAGKPVVIDVRDGDDWFASFADESERAPFGANPRRRDPLWTVITTENRLAPPPTPETVYEPGVKLGVVWQSIWRALFRRPAL